MSRKISYLTLHGSRAYGLNRPDSDFDIRGFFLPPVEQLLGFFESPEQVTDSDFDIPGIDFDANKKDVVVWDIRKFFRLAAAGNPNVLEVLFTDSSDVLVKDSFATEILDNKVRFLSKRVRNTFGGYAVAQLKKARTQDWENPRTRKYALHLLRVLHFGTQVLTSATLSVKVQGSTKDDLLKVLSKDTKREDVLAKAEKLLYNMNIAVKDSKLPDEPDVKELNDLLVSILYRSLQSNGRDL